MTRIARTLALCAVAVAAALTTGALVASPAAADFSYGDIARVAPNTLMVVGRPLALDKGEGDVANTILHKAGDTLYVIDTGATPSFRSFLRKAIDRLRPFSRVVLINSHGHPDHFGNNALVAGLKGVSIRHYMSRRDFPLADHYLAALTQAFENVSGYIPGFDNPAEEAKSEYDLFLPLEQSTRTRRAIESLPLRRIQIGKLRTKGWVFGDDDMVVWNSAAHTPGHLVVYFPKIGLLHTGDETTAYYPAFPEANATRTRVVFAQLLRATTGSDVRIQTDGHEFAILRGGAAIRAHLRGLIAGYDALVDVVHRTLVAAGTQGATISDLVAAVSNDAALEAAPGGGQGGDFFFALQALIELDREHATVAGGDTRATQRWVLPGAP